MSNAILIVLGSLFGVISGWIFDFDPVLCLAAALINIVAYAWDPFDAHFTTGSLLGIGLSVLLTS